MRSPSCTRSRGLRPQHETNDIGEEIELLLRSPERLADMSKAAFENGKPHAALDVAKLILNSDVDELSAVGNERDS